VQSAARAGPVAAGVPTRSAPTADAARNLFRCLIAAVYLVDYIRRSLLDPATGDLPASSRERTRLWAKYSILICHW